MNQSPVQLSLSQSRKVEKEFYLSGGGGIVFVVIYLNI